MCDLKHQDKCNRISKLVVHKIMSVKFYMNRNGHSLNLLYISLIYLSMLYHAQANYINIYLSNLPDIHIHHQSFIYTQTPNSSNLLITHTIFTPSVFNTSFSTFPFMLKITFIYLKHLPLINLFLSSLNSPLLKSSHTTVSYF